MIIFQILANCKFSQHARSWHGEI